MRPIALLLASLVAGCAGTAPVRQTAQPVPAVEVLFEPAPFPYRVGPEVMTSAVDPRAVRAELGAQGSLLGCDAIVDVTISQTAHNGKARSWGFCAYRVSHK